MPCRPLRSERDYVTRKLRSSILHLEGHRTITLRELATLLAALALWKDEITQSGDFSARPYLKTVVMGGVTPLSATEIDQLSAKLRSLSVSE